MKTNQLDTTNVSVILYGSASPFTDEAASSELAALLGDRFETIEGSRPVGRPLEEGERVDILGTANAVILGYAESLGFALDLRRLTRYVSGTGVSYRVAVRIAA